MIRVVIIDWFWIYISFFYLLYWQFDDTFLEYYVDKVIYNFFCKYKKR